MSDIWLATGGDNGDDSAMLGAHIVCGQGSKKVTGRVQGLLVLELKCHFCCILSSKVDHKAAPIQGARKQTPPFHERSYKVLLWREWI